MFSPSLIQERDYFGPFLSILTDELKNDKVFLLAPISMLFVNIQVIEPSLPAVLRWPKYSSIRDIEHFLWYLIPLSSFLEFYWLD